ncbi:Crp/Fnr family transcriptional regulator [Goodfellowiella coeruleoviolacea]|uniref:cAMP-binding domain of CRP or a regulatory subunit of cAMP-dependent protein kinases n=1 Tax=Goodfellowiella coeruleoviolacea TaxID=334858 RepID=A0AAE3GEQ5_9PSEU|nr:Crp/Fnr family transcriptional regulator [Goodfellowiella coeruleoviolacea]MCP2166780.1 cAMP-binding domain of CRP or a regulatory subunit of cAMP-dependent protein kinases [Goodfellowiella coeruleoviolacea]
MSGQGAQSARRGFRRLVPESAWQALLDSGVPRVYRPGEELVRQGAAGGFVLALTSGRTMVIGRQDDGSQLLLALRGPGELIGEMASRESEFRSATVQAIDRCTAVFLFGHAFRRFLVVNELQSAFTDYVKYKLFETVPYRVQLVQFKPLHRMARLMAELVALAGPELANPWRIPFTQETLALSLGLARSTVSEAISLLRAEGVLAPGPRLVVADPSALRRHAGLVP